MLLIFGVYFVGLLNAVLSANTKQQILGNRSVLLLLLLNVFQKAKVKSFTTKVYWLKNFPEITLCFIWKYEDKPVGTVGRAFRQVKSKKK